jgi:hypothetical protein
MWYWVLNIAIALWVLFDARSRKMDQSVLWAIGTSLLMIFVIPFYFAKRPLKDGEVREGGTVWNVMKSFAIFWTLFMSVAGLAGMIAAGGIVTKASSGAEHTGAAMGMAIGMSMIMGLWFIVIVGALVIGLFVKKSSIVEKGPTGVLKGGANTAEKKCPHCATMISAEAKICPHCRKIQVTSIFVSVIVIFIVLYAIGEFSITPQNSSISDYPSQTVPSAPAEPLLELQTWRWSENYSYVIAEGSVKNISGRSLERIMAVVQFHDKNGNFITSADALIDYNPILPNQISPFKVMATYNPEMKNASIEFKYLMGGTIEHNEKVKQKKKLNLK